MYLCPIITFSNNQNIKLYFKMNDQAVMQHPQDMYLGALGSHDGMR